MPRKRHATDSNQIEFAEKDKLYSKIISSFFLGKFRFVRENIWPIIYAFVTLAIIFFALLVYSNLYILRYKKFIVSPFDISSSTYGVVFGGGVKDKKLPAMPMDRMIEGVALYKQGKIGKLMITGDDGAFKGDEVDVMSKVALEYGIPKKDILIDPHGYRTYESCYRESKIYGVKNAVVVSQSFHLPRIIYMCRHFGIDTVGVASDLQGYGWNSVFMDVREWGARLKAWWQITFSKPLPRDLTKR